MTQLLTWFFRTIVLIESRLFTFELNNIFLNDKMSYSVIDAQIQKNLCNLCPSMRYVLCACLRRFKKSSRYIYPLLDISFRLPAILCSKNCDHEIVSTPVITPSHESPAHDRSRPARPFLKNGSQDTPRTFWRLKHLFFFFKFFIRRNKRSENFQLNTALFELQFFPAPSKPTLSCICWLAEVR